MTRELAERVRPRRDRERVIGDVAVEVEEDQPAPARLVEVASGVG